MVKLLSLSIAVVLAMLLLLPSPAGVTAASGISRCYTNQLALKPVATSGGMGHLGMEFAVRNTSDRFCSLYGYPGVTLLTGQRKPLPTHVRWGVGYLNGDAAKRLVMLHPGQSGYLAIEWVHFPTPGQPCPWSRYMAIIPPNDYRAIQVYTGPVQACGGRLTATPVTAKPNFGYPKPGTEPGLP